MTVINLIKDKFNSYEEGDGYSDDHNDCVDDVDDDYDDDDDGDDDGDDYDDYYYYYGDSKQMSLRQIFSKSTLLFSISALLNCHNRLRIWRQTTLL